MKIILNLAVFLALSTNMYAQETYISARNLKMDLDSMISIIEQVHPNPYTVVSKDSLDSFVEQAKISMKDSLSLIEFYTIAAPVVSMLNDGHTGIKFPYTEWQTTNPFCFPFNPQINNNGKLFAGPKQGFLPPEAEILSINKVNSNNIVETLVASISGESVEYRISILQNSFIERYGACYGFVPEYILEYSIDGAMDTITINATRLQQMLTSSKKRKQDESKKSGSNNQYYSFRQLEEHNAGLIDFKSFADIDLFKTFLDSVFTIVHQQGISNLIIDIRNNSGGNSILGDELFQYISPAPFQQFGKTTTKYSRQRKELYDLYREKGFFSHMDDSAYNQLFSYPPGSLITDNDTSKIALRKNPLRFTGNVYLLTSINTFSSATDFAWCFKYFEMGTIVGAETGGYIVCFGDLINVSLPISGLELFISHQEFYGYGATENERHGVKPDYAVAPGDALEFTLDLIKNTE